MWGWGYYYIVYDDELDWYAEICVCVSILNKF